MTCQKWLFKKWRAYTHINWWNRVIRVDRKTRESLLGVRSWKQKISYETNPSILWRCKATEQRRCSYHWRPKARKTFSHEHYRRRQPKSTLRSCSQTGRWRQVSQMVAPSQLDTRPVYRRLPGSGPAKQRKKKDSSRKSSSATARVEFPLAHGHNSK
jgi:hypothetical protein